MRSLASSTSKLNEAKQYLSGGVSSSLRAGMKPTPLYVKSASGTRVTDIDGNEYIDYLLAYGPLILGHAHPRQIEKIHQAMKVGLTYGLQHQGEIQLAQRLVELLPCAEKVVFSGSGTEAVMLALRLAKAHTGKQKIVRFHGHYHGWSDSIFTSFPASDVKQKNSAAHSDQITAGTSGQSDKSLEDIILLPWNDPKALEQALKASFNEIAAVITEPVMCNSGCITPQPGYLEKMRELTAQLGIVLIFDETITGFRLGMGGAHERFGILPDLMTMGKALGGGIAISAVAGKDTIMSLIENGSVNHLGTLNGNCVATAAALATIEELSKEDGALFTSMEQVADELCTGLRLLMRKHDFSGVINQIGPVFHMMFIAEDKVENFTTFQKRNAEQYTIFSEYLLNEGVIVRSSGLWYVSTLHKKIEIDETLAAVDRALKRLKNDLHS